jgi:hypothetical protein
MAPWTIVLIWDMDFGCVENAAAMFELIWCPLYLYAELG